MSNFDPPKRLQKHRWEIESQCLTLMNPLSCDEPSENVSSIFSEHYGHSLGPEVRLTIDVSDVEDFDTSGIAFLVMFRHRLIDSQTQMCLVGSSPRLQGILELLGLSYEFGLTPTAETIR